MSPSTRHHYSPTVEHRKCAPYLLQESPKNLFRLLMCRDLEFSRLRGIIFDHACGLNQYIMNREPQRFQYLRTLVDGVHFRGHKKTKKGTSKKGGHSGCSNGFNSMEYKKYWKSGYYTQGREQIHSQIDALTPSFRQMSYQSYMVMLRTFFALNNLKKREQIKFFCQLQSQQTAALESRDPR